MPLPFWRPSREMNEKAYQLSLKMGFIEPLESNGLLTIHEFLLKLVTFLGREVINQWDIDVYNRGTFRFFDDFAQFVSLHYALSVREDTEYWREIRSRSLSLDMIHSLFLSFVILFCGGFFCVT